MVKYHSHSERGNPLPPHGLLFSINSKGSFICTIPDRIAHTTAFVTPVWRHITVNKVLSASLNKTFPSFLPARHFVLKPHVIKRKCTYQPIITEIFEYFFKHLKKIFCLYNKKHSCTCVYFILFFKYYRAPSTPTLKINALYDSNYKRN